MSDLHQQFQEDRQLRDTARVILMADIAHARTSLSATGLAGRIGGRIGDGAKDVFEVAKTQSEDNRGVIAALIGAVLLWLAREPILEIFGLSRDDDGDYDDDFAGPGPYNTDDNCDANSDDGADVAGEANLQQASATPETLPPGEYHEQ